MFTYITKVKKDTIEYEIRVKLGEDGQWYLDEVGKRLPRQREFRYQLTLVRDSYRNKGYSYEEICELATKSLKDMIGEDIYNEVLMEAWNSIKPKF